MIYFCACAFRIAAHRRLVAAMIASLPAVLSLRFFLTGVGGATLAVCDLDSCWVSAHRLVWAALNLARVATGTRCVLFAEVAPFAEPPTHHLTTVDSLGINSLLLFDETLHGRGQYFLAESGGHIT